MKIFLYCTTLRDLTLNWYFVVSQFRGISKEQVCVPAVVTVLKISKVACKGRIEKQKQKKRLAALLKGGTFYVLRQLIVIILGERTLFNDSV